MFKLVSELDGGLYYSGYSVATDTKTKNFPDSNQFSMVVFNWLNPNRLVTMQSWP